jgi:hypothetical protein
LLEHVVATMGTKAIVETLLQQWELREISGYHGGEYEDNCLLG